jgi:protein-disulfide isomerase
MEENDMNNSPAAADSPAAEPKPESAKSRPVRKATPKPVAKPAPKAAKKATRKVVKEVRRERRAEPMSRQTMMTIFIILGILALVTSFVVGYLLAKGGSTTKTGSVTGDKLQVIEYSDFECPFCSRAAPTVEQLKAAYGNRIEVIYKHFPLESIHPNALNAAIASECVRQDEGEEAFWQYHDVLFANQQALDVASLKRYASDLGFDIAVCLDSKETESIVREHMQEGLGHGVQGTPSFWIKDELIVGAQPYSVIKDKIDEKLSGQAAAPSQPSQPSAPSAPSAPVNVELGSHVIGDADAPITIVEFSDFQCPFCARFFSETEGQLMDQYVDTGKVKIAYRHFPLSFHQNAQKAAEASECAAKVGGNDAFWKYHDILFQRGQGDGTGLNNADLKAYAAELKLDTTKFNSCLDGGEMASVVQKDFADGQAAGVSGTPSFYLNGQQIVGAQPFSVFKAAIDAELS